MLKEIKQLQDCVDKQGKDIKEIKESLIGTELTGDGLVKQVTKNRKDISRVKYLFLLISVGAGQAFDYLKGWL